MLYEGEMVYYYSDQRDKKYGQKLDHQMSEDLRTWNPPVDDVVHDPKMDARSERKAARPGMTTIAKLPNGKYILTYEYCNYPDSQGGGCPVHYRLSDNPLNFVKAKSHLLEFSNPAGKRSRINGSPYVVWTPEGGPNGTIVVSCSERKEVFINRSLGAENDWKNMGVPGNSSYTRSLLVMADQKHILVVGGGPMGGKSNSVTAARIDISK